MALEGAEAAAWAAEAAPAQPNPAGSATGRTRAPLLNVQFPCTGANRPASVTTLIPASPTSQKAPAAAWTAVKLPGPTAGHVACRAQS